jgi:hypothetical protein
MIRTKDGRKFLTSEENLGTLIEFCRTFGSEIYKAKADNGAEILALKSLTTAFCQTTYTEPACEVSKQIFPSVPLTRSKMIEEASEVRVFIQNELDQGKTVSMQTLKQRFPGVNYAKLANNFSKIRKMMKNSGVELEKIGAGAYALKSKISIINTNFQGFQPIIQP